MVLPSSQPVTSLVCGGTTWVSPGVSRGSGSGGGCRWARGWESLPARPGPEPGTRPVSSHQVPGITGALSSLRVPGAPLEGEDHVPAPVGVEHQVPGRDVDVEKLGWASRGLQTHQVGEHMVACSQGGQSCKNKHSRWAGSFSRFLKRQKTCWSASSATSSGSFF